MKSFIEYINDTYRLKNFEDIFYSGCGCPWSIDLNGKKFNLVKREDIYNIGCGCSWFSYDNIKFNKLEGYKKPTSIHSSNNNYRRDNNSVNDKVKEDNTFEIVAGAIILGNIFNDD